MDEGHTQEVGPSRNFRTSGRTQKWNMTSTFIKKLTSGTKFVYEFAVVLYLLVFTVSITDMHKEGERPSQFHRWCF